MVCIYCGNKTQVTNSRPQKRLNRTWRRRECLSCGAVFSTSESADYESSIVVRADHARPQPFSRDKLFASILQAVGHRKTAVADAGALTDTIIAQLLRSTAQAAISPSAIILATFTVLERFDGVAAVQYQAYHTG